MDVRSFTSFNNAYILKKYFDSFPMYIPLCDSCGFLPTGCLLCLTLCLKVPLNPEIFLNLILSSQINVIVREIIYFPNNSN